MLSNTECFYLLKDELEIDGKKAKKILLAFPNYICPLF